MSKKCPKCSVVMFTTDEGICPCCDNDKHPHRIAILKLQHPEADKLCDSEVLIVAATTKPVTDLDEVIRLLVIRVYHIHRGGRAMMAKSLGRSDKNVYDMCRAYGLPLKSEYNDLF